MPTTQGQRRVVQQQPNAKSSANGIVVARSPTVSLAAQNPPNSSAPTHARQVHTHTTTTSTSEPEPEEEEQEEELEITRSFERRYLFHRPRALQYEKSEPASHHGVSKQHHHEMGRVTPPGHQKKEAKGSGGGKMQGPKAAVELEDAAVDPRPRRVQLALFVDLIWVGVVANLADKFSEQAFGDGETSLGGAFLSYLLSFRLVTRIWYDLNGFMNHFYTDDTSQRFFILIVLILIVLFGNTSPSLDVYKGSTINTIIEIYIVIRGLFTVVKVIYGHFNPWLLRAVRIEALLTIPILGLWIGCLFLRMPHKLVLFLITMVVEDFVAVLPSTPLFNRMIKGYKLATDLEHYLERISAFFTVILGSGVFLLISGSPAGNMVAAIMAYVAPGFIIFFNLYWIYMKGDQTRKYLHATRRSWIPNLIWRVLHIPLWGTILILGVSIRALITVQTSGSDDAHVGTVRANAQWVTAAALSETMLLVSIIPLLHKSLDPPGTLRVNNRGLRLLPRLLMIPAICGATYGERNMDTSCQLWTLAGISGFVTFWDIYAGWSRDGMVFEPKAAVRNAPEREAGDE